MRFQFIQKNRSSFPVNKMCQVLNVSSSGFYRWNKAALSSQSRENDRLKKRLRELYAEHNGMAGSPMITADLQAENAFSRVGKNRVARLMREMKIKSRTVKKYVLTTDSKHNHPIAPTC